MGVYLEPYSIVKSQPIIPYFINVVAGVGSTASTTPVDYPGPVTKVINKRYSATSLLVSGHVGAFKGTNVGIISIYLQLTGVAYPIPVDYLLSEFFFNELNSHRNITFTVPIAQTKPADVYTAKVRWSTPVTSANSNTGDTVQIRIEEGYWA